MIRTRVLLSLALAVALQTTAPASDPPTVKRRPALRQPAATSPIEAVPDRPVTRPVPTAEQIDLPKMRTRTVQQPKSTSRPTVEMRTSGGVGSDIPSLLRALDAKGPYDVSASGRYIIAADSEGGLTLIDGKLRRRLRQLENSLQNYSLVKISPDARWIAGVRIEDPSQIDLWRADNGHLVRTITGEPGAMTALEFEGAELRVSSSSGNGVAYSVPGGEVVGGFQSATGRAGMAPRKAPPQTVTIGPRAMVPEGSESGSAGAMSAGPKETQHSRLRAQPTPSATMAPPSMPESAAPPDAAFESASPSEVAPGSAPVAAEPMAAEPMMSEPTAAEPMGAEPMAAEPMAAEPSSAAPMAAAPEAAAESAPPTRFRTGSPRSAVPAREAAPPASAAPATSAPAAAAPMAAEPMNAQPMAAEPMASPAPAAARQSAPSAAPNLEMGPQVDGLRTFTFSANDSEPASAPADEAVGADTLPQAAAGDLAALKAKPEAQVPPPEEDLSNITVHYATNRNRLTDADRQWQAYFRAFFFSLPAVVGYVVILLALLIFPWMGKRGWAAASVISGVFLLCSMAAFEAYVRSQLRDELSGELYGSAPTTLNYGTCTISVPKPENRSPGELNRPLSVWVFEAPENPDKHFVLRKVDEHDGKEEFYASLSQQLANSADGTSLLFIHGYNVSFEDAIFRTAQLAVDLKFRGAPISFSWPSYADPVKYTFDEQNAEVSVPALAEFLEDLSTRSGAKRIHIIAHSMGNRVLAGALRSMSPEARAKNKAMFREIVLAAPDIDSRVFQSQVLPHIQDSTQHCTLYASSRDRALMLSRYFHNYQRLGETLPQLVVTPGMDTIDASLVDTSLLGHSYIGDVQSIVSDLHELVVDGKRPTERIWLQSSPLGELIYWAIKPQVQTAAEAEAVRK